MDCGFEESQLDSVCITFDKMDKIGLEGVKNELEEKEFAEAAIAKFTGFLANVSNPQEISLESVKDILVDKAPAESLEYIMKSVNELCNGEFNVVFDLSLVRGQGYYTGTVFEVVSNEFKGSVAGGGRYDKLIGKFIGRDIPAVGFSIGFERIFAILSENGAACAETKKRIALLYDEGQVAEAVKEADKLRAEGLIVSLFVKPKKTGKFIDKLEEKGFAGFINLSVKPDVVYFEN